jgi:hypothetical protein
METGSKLVWAEHEGPGGLSRNGWSRDGEWSVKVKRSVDDVIRGTPRSFITFARNGVASATTEFFGSFDDAKRLAQTYIDDVLAREASEAAATSSLVTEQAPPVENAHPAVWPLVLADMQARDGEGRRKYGVPLQPHNGRDTLVDLYQELLDAAVYTRTLIYERDGK